MTSLQCCHSLLARDAPAFSLAPTSIAAPSLPASRRRLPNVTACALPDSENRASPCDDPASSIRRGLLAGVIATGASAAIFTNVSWAAIGPGGDGARRTAEKADDLLKAADKLNIEEAPPRYGPGRPGPLQDETKISQIGGSGSMSATGDATAPSKGTSAVAKMAEAKSPGFLEGLSKSFQNVTGQAGANEETTTEDGSP